MANSYSMANPSPLQITCADGYILSASLYVPASIKAAIMIAPATGIKKTFYHSFATFLCENGYGVITYDNRGIADSKNGPLKQSDASLVDWGKLDMTAVLEELKNRFPNTTYHLIGHSAGGQLLGLMDNAPDIKSLFNFACSSGSIRNMRFPFNLKAHFFLNMFIPVNNLLFGYSNSQWLGMGEPLPKTVGKQWGTWCSGSGYVKVELGKTIHQHHYDDLQIPSLWLHATDDDIANYENVKDMVRVYSKIQSEIITLNPKECGYKEIGHMKFFSSKYKELWKYALDWLDKYQ